MAVAYFDESGRGDGYALAGLVAEGDVWASFSRDWAKALNAAPKIRYFKAKEASKFVKQFNRFSENMRDEKLASLMNVLQRYRPYQVTDTLNLAMFSEAIQKYNTRYPDPYYLCFGWMIYTLTMHAPNMRVQAPIDCVFDNQVILEKRLRRMWPTAQEAVQAAFPNLVPVLAPAPRFADDRDELPLQAADALAWLQRDWLEVDLGGTNRSPLKWTGGPADAVSQRLSEANDLQLVYGPIP